MHGNLRLEKVFNRHSLVKAAKVIGYSTLLTAAFCGGTALDNVLFQKNDFGLETLHGIAHSEFLANARDFLGGFCAFPAMASVFLPVAGAGRLIARLERS